MLQTPVEIGDGCESPQDVVPSSKGGPRAGQDAPAAPSGHKDEAAADVDGAARHAAALASTGGLRVGMTVWAAEALEQVKNNGRGDMRFGIRQHDVGVIVKLPSDELDIAVVVWRHIYAAKTGLKVEWASNADRRFYLNRSLLLSANPAPQRKDAEKSALFETVCELKRWEPQLTAKQVFERVATTTSSRSGGSSSNNSASPPTPTTTPAAEEAEAPPTLSAIKLLLKLLNQQKLCPLVHRLSPDAQELVAAHLPLPGLLDLSATCGNLRSTLMDARLARSEANVMANAK